MRPDKALALIISATLAVACSNQQQNAKPEIVAQTAAAASVAAPSNAPTAAGAPAGRAVDADLVKEGYQVVKRQDKVLYCRTQSTTGTRFTSTVCMTGEQIQSQRRALQDQKDALNKTHASSCLGNTCNN
jgi:hypothetical protein